MDWRFIVKNGKKNYLTSLSFGVATVWFSTHCGAGFASGTQELQFFANHGWFGTLMPILTIILIALTYYVGLETARQTDNWGYDAWAKEAYGKYSKVLTPAMDASVIITTIAACAACIASGGLLGNQYLGLPVIVGSVAIVVLVILLVIFGEELVRKNATIMTIIILAIVSIVIVAGLIKFGPDIVRMFSEGYVNPQSAKWGISASDETVPGNVLNSLLWALTYAGFQISAIGGIAASFKGAVSKEEAKGAMILGSIMNILMLVGICLLLFSQMPDIYLNEATRALPTIAVVEQLNIPILKVLYPVLLFLALITTAVGFTFGMVARFEPHVMKNETNPIKKKAIIAAGSLITCYLVSTLGLLWIVQNAYKYLGIFNLVLIVLPLWILGYKNIKKRDELANN